MSSKRVRLCIQGAFPESKVSEILREEQLGLYIPKASLIAVDDINVSALSESFSDFQQWQRHHAALTQRQQPVKISLASLYIIDSQNYILYISYNIIMVHSRCSVPYCNSA